ncbi:MAG TPA: DUF1800 domain-containing protein [Rhodobacteraceae bacterium]|nr:DUF1800 domain-containing protein [Paracoccaceae bacterium]
MTFDPDTAAIRFGTGLSPEIAPPTGVDEMLRRLSGPDRMARQFQIDGFDRIEQLMSEIQALNRERRQNPERKTRIKEQVRSRRRQARQLQAGWLKSTIARGVFTNDGLRERLVDFWADHFTVKGKRSITRPAVSTYVEDAIRPNIAGSFATLLKAAIFHPMMLSYLDQINSVGPNSLVAVRKPGRGMNENLAREVLELHTLGVNAGYTQKDVVELAKLFTGLTYRMGKGFVYGVKMAEPGAETVLGKSYGGYRNDLSDIEDFLEDVAVHPDTARHLARKLVVHFISDTPDRSLVDHIAATYLESGGNLMQAYSAMLGHPSAWALPGRKVKQPSAFVIAAIRALAVPKQRIMEARWQDVRDLIYAPLGLMGQPWQNPAGPDGWPEEAEHWITPQGLAARIQWAMTVPAIMRPDLPDPRRFVQTALGNRADDRLRFAVAAAEVKSEGVGLVLVSPAFQRN